MDSVSPIYQLLTRYRFHIFGLALIWIFFRHTSYYNQFTYGLLNPLVQIGDCGVDVFLFLSGFGLYFSYSKTCNIKEFYVKRFFRLLPSVIILILSFAVIEVVLNINGGFKEIISLSYWFFAIYSKNWFIGAILLFYIAYPFIYSFLVKNSKITLIGSFIVAIIGILIIDLFEIKILKQLVVYFARIPVFVFGSVFAKNIHFFNHKYPIVFYVFLTLPLLYVLPKSFQRLLYCFVTLGVVTYLPYMFKVLPLWINTYLKMIGKASLEFYLIHIYLFCNDILGEINDYCKSEILTVIIVLGIVSILAVLCNKIISMIMRLLINEKKIRRTE